MFGRKKVEKKGQIHFQHADKTVDFYDEESVLDVALSNDVWIDHSCGGQGSCTTCRIKILSPLENLSPRTELEKERAEERGFTHDERLACQLQPVDGLKVNPF